MSWIDEKSDRELSRVREAKDSSVYPYFRPFESGGLRTSVGGHKIISFSSNDYLGLTTHPDVIRASHIALDRYANGMSSSRIQATTVEHVKLEARLAKYFGFEACLITTTGYQAMVGTIMALADEDTTIILDALSHACILDGSFLAAGVPGKESELRLFNHNSIKGLERVLKSRERKNALVVVEGIYSLDGDLGKLAEITEICARYDAPLIVDDAHGSGTLGTHGRGTLEKLGLEGRAPIIVTTFSKVFGGIGGVILASANVIEHIKHTARSFVFSATLPVPVVAAAATILDMLEAHGPEMVRELSDKAEFMRRELTRRGFDLGDSTTHIMPVMVREEKTALLMHQILYGAGYYLVPITSPGVKAGEERLRLNVTRGHTYAELASLIEKLTDLGKTMKIVDEERYRAFAANPKMEVPRDRDGIFPPPKSSGDVPAMHAESRTNGGWVSEIARKMPHAPRWAQFMMPPAWVYEKVRSRVAGE